MCGGWCCISLAALLVLLAGWATGQSLLVPMDGTQRNHLKAYGLIYWALDEPRRAESEWLLNYRGGSFLIRNGAVAEEKARLMGVTAEMISAMEVGSIHAAIEEGNMNAVLLEKAPRVAVYTPPGSDPWDDAVTLALEYAEIPYTKIWDREVLAGRLYDFDWLHLHHEDFTGQYGKFFGNYHNAAWYRSKVSLFAEAAEQAGFPTVQAHKGAVAWAIRKYVEDGGFLFAMCAATDTLDIALAAQGIDIVAPEIDGTPLDPDYQEKLNFDNCMAFTNFRLIPEPLVYEFSDIDASVVEPGRGRTVPSYRNDHFTLFSFAAKADPVPTMLTQCHSNRIADFLGQTHGFRKPILKRGVVVLAEFPGEDVVKYAHGNLGKGTWTFLAGHDPEDYEHYVGDPPTDLDLYKNSAGYRLILNNILFPAAKKKERKT